jgi:hypothetical protein
MSEIDRLGRQALNPREVLVERLQRRQHSEERRPGDRFHDQAMTFLSQNRFLTRQLQIAWNAQCLIATVLEQANVAFRLALPLGHMLDICYRIMSEKTSAFRLTSRSFLRDSTRKQRCHGDLPISVWLNDSRQAAVEKSGDESSQINKIVYPASQALTGFNLAAISRLSRRMRIARVDTDGSVLHP